MAEQIESIDLTGKQPVIQGDISVWGTKLNAIDLEFVEKLNEVIDNINTLKVYNINSLDSITTITSSSTLGAYNNILATGTITLTLPNITDSVYNTYKIKNIGTGTITIDGYGFQTIDGALTISIPNQYDSVTLTCNSTSWFIV